MNMQALALAFLRRYRHRRRGMGFLYPLLSGETKGRKRAAHRSQERSRSRAPHRPRASARAANRSKDR